MDGSIGRCLRVNLTEGKHRIEEIDPRLFEKFLGGRGLGVKVFTDEVDPQTDPLSPDNKLILASGPLVGTGAKVRRIRHGHYRG
jgi:aldehyde:ferredoxin oxidoreductase